MCDERTRLLQLMPLHVYNNPPGARANPANLPPCVPHDLASCPVKRQGNVAHIVHATGRIKRDWRVCPTCADQVFEMVDEDRQLWLGGLPPIHRRGQTSFFYGLHGIWQRGHLCQRCQNDEIAAYHQRLHSGRQTQAAREKAANTCTCKAKLRKRYCLEDREGLLEDLYRKATSNAIGMPNLALPPCWLEFLEYDPALGRAVRVENDPHRIRLNRQRRLGGRNPAGGNAWWNGCRCGRDIPVPVLPAAPFPVTIDGLPTPVAMCTACSGVIIDVNSPQVANYAAMARQARGAGNAEERNLKLGRVVPIV